MLSYHNFSKFIYEPDTTENRLKVAVDYIKELSDRCDYWQTQAEVAAQKIDIINLSLKEEGVEVITSGLKSCLVIRK